jgi:HPt (histidine-containing phosphotransfer) domain-containing protein
VLLDSVKVGLAELDIETGLRFLGGNRARYRNMLDKFVAQHAQDAELIRAALDAGWTDEARRLVHGLKSVAATLGAVPLSETAYALELRLKAALDDPEQPADVDLPLAALTEALAKLINGMKATTT